MKEDLLKIIHTYGVLPQLKYFQSEVFELNEAIIRHEEILKSDFTYSNEIWSKQSITEEIADIQVMLDQIQHYYRIEDEEIWKIMRYKIDRQLERINNENK